ncbi:hypothetical protein P692DRAFT_20923069, partial [Suillus brevipes Sb2]
MPYFPTELAWTHAIQPPPPPKPSSPSLSLPSSTPSPARRSKLVNANLRQTTIPYPTQPKPAPKCTTPSSS